MAGAVSSKLPLLLHSLRFLFEFIHSWRELLCLPDRKPVEHSPYAVSIECRILPHTRRATARHTGQLYLPVAAGWVEGTLALHRLFPLHCPERETRRSLLHSAAEREASTALLHEVKTSGARSRHVYLAPLPTPSAGPRTASCMRAMHVIERHAAVWVKMHGCNLPVMTHFCSGNLL